eukprot:8629705-Ditylum_brightwellii.AAC.1
MLPDHAQPVVFRHLSSPLKREQIDVGPELGIADGTELILGSDVGAELGIVDGMELGSDESME